MCKNDGKICRGKWRKYLCHDQLCELERRIITTFLVHIFDHPLLNQDYNEFAYFQGSTQDSFMTILEVLLLKILLLLFLYLNEITILGKNIMENKRKYETTFIK